MNKLVGQPKPVVAGGNFKANEALADGETVQTLTLTQVTAKLYDVEKRLEKSEETIRRLTNNV